MRISDWSSDVCSSDLVTGFIRENGAIVGVETTRGTIRAGKVGVAVAGSTSVVLQKAGLRDLPIESHVLQAFVSEALKPLIDTVVTFGAGHLRSEEHTSELQSLMRISYAVC